MLNEHDFPPLSNICQPILSNVSESRLYQRNPTSNVNVGSVHLSPVLGSKPVCFSNATKRNVCNTSSVSQLIKPLNVTKSVCSSKETKCNLCNASSSSVSKLIKPLNVSKTVCSNNTNGRNVCKVIKPSTVSKPVLSTNVHNVCNVSSISQLVKIINATKSVCSSNAINSVICNSTCKPVSNFISDCQSVKPVLKLIDVNRRRSHE